MSGKVVVVGAGVIGAATAWRLAERGWEVELWSDRPAEATTSVVAAALWRPYRAEPAEKIDPWSAASLAVYEEFARDPASGVLLTSGIELNRTPLPTPSWASALPDFRHAEPAELAGDYRDGFVYTAPVAEMQRHLPWLLARLGERGVAVRQERVEDLWQLARSVGRVVNATGLAARELVPDDAVYPVRGQVVRLRNPGIDRFRLDYDHPRGLTYVIPRRDDVIVGGTDQEHSGDTAADADQTAAILARGEELCPELRGAEVLGAAVGLRPARSSVRLERVDDGDATLVHNYGHGGSGMTVAWGCAAEACDLLGEPD